MAEDRERPLMPVPSFSSPLLQREPRVQRVLILAVLFWLTGAIICLGFASLNVFVKLSRPHIRSQLSGRTWAGYASIGCGVVIGLLQAYYVFIPIARRETTRILSTSPLRFHHFFPKPALLAVLCVAVACAVTEKLTETHVASILTFSVLLTAVGVALAAGAALLASSATRRAATQCAAVSAEVRVRDMVRDGGEPHA